MSKAAVRSLTQTAGDCPLTSRICNSLDGFPLALELAEHNITVNAYAPGIILTRMSVTEHDKNFGGEPGAAAKHVSSYLL